MIQFVAESHVPKSFDDFLCDLLVDNRTSPAGPWRLSAGLSLVDLGTAEFFLNARLFLTALVEENGAPTTATGNLNRAFVGRMFDRLKIPDVSRQSINHCCKVLNELDLWAGRDSPYSALEEVYPFCLERRWAMKASAKTGRSSPLFPFGAALMRCLRYR